jgi:hypothetical protein
VGESGGSADEDEDDMMLTRRATSDLELDKGLRR